MPSRPYSSFRALSTLLLAAVAALLPLHFLHLGADFPNHSPWMDWSKYTDEGWYGDAAIRHFLLGHWYVAGDFNPAAALPVWPALEALLFSATGVSLVAARALTVCVFVATLAASWFLLANRATSPPHLDDQSPAAKGRSAHHPSLAAPVAVLLLAASPFCFVFTRLAILEPLLVLLTLLAILAARSAGRVPNPQLLRPGIATLALALLLPLMVLTKTTALFLTPAVFWMLFGACSYRARPFLRVAVPATVLGTALWLAYFLAVVRPHFLIDYRYLFSANAYTGMTRENFSSVLASTITDGTWIGPILYPLALAAAVLAVAVAVARPARLAPHPLIGTLLLWSGGYTTFLAYHNNLQPRYYLVVAVPLTLLLPVVFEDLLLPYLRRQSVRSAVIALAAVAVTAVVLPDVQHTVRYAVHPEYTLLDAARSVAARIAQDRQSDPTHNPLILSISGSDISLMTGLPSICDDFGTSELVDRVREYRPGWYVAWNQVEDDKLDALWPQFELERTASFPAMDDPDRNLLILYKLIPAGSRPPRSAGKRKPTPRRLRTPLGQQPSTSQLQH